MAKGQAGVVQPLLIPAKAIFCGPYKTNTLDTSEGCFCDDECGYVVKSDSPANPRASHCEWLCAHVANAISLPIMGFNKVEHTDGNVWFGSEWNRGEISDWWTACQQGAIAFDNLKTDLSRIYAFDLFVHNVDRHLKNYIVKADGAGHRIYTMDHGRAWLFNGFPPPLLPMSQNSNTVAARDWLKLHFPGYQLPQVMLDTIEGLRKVDGADIQRILADQPANWLPQAQSDAIVKWWNDGEAALRLDVIANGIGDGSLL